MEDLEKRRRIVKALLAKGPEFGLARKHKGELKVGDAYTRLSSREKRLSWEGDEPPESATIRAAVRKKLDEMQPRLDGLAAILRQII
jgi:hypothetical protein